MPAIGDRSHARSLRRTPPIQQAVFLTVPMCPLIYPAPGIGVPMNDVVLAMGPDALRGQAGPLPADSAADANLSPKLLALKQEAERRFAGGQATGRGLGASSLADAVVVFLGG